MTDAMILMEDAPRDPAFQSQQKPLGGLLRSTIVFGTEGGLVEQRMSEAGEASRLFSEQCRSAQ